MQCVAQKRREKRWSTEIDAFKKIDECETDHTTPGHINKFHICMAPRSLRPVPEWINKKKNSANAAQQQFQSKTKTEK